MFYDAINASFDFGFEKTLELAVRCRTEFLMRKSTAQILAIGAAHPFIQSVLSSMNRIQRSFAKSCLVLASAERCATSKYEVVVVG